MSSTIEGKISFNPLTNIKWKPHGPISYNDDEDEEEKVQNSDKQNFLVVSTDGTLKEYSFEKNKVVGVINGDSGNQLFALDSNSTGTVFACAGRDAIIRIYDAKSRKLFTSISKTEVAPGHSNRI